MTFCISQSCVNWGKEKKPVKYLWEIFTRTFTATQLYLPMKMHPHLRVSSIVYIKADQSLFAPLTSNYDVMMQHWFHKTLSCHNTGQGVIFGHPNQNKWVKLPESYFPTWWPWPLTLAIELVWDLVKVHQCTKFGVHMSNNCTKLGVHMSNNSAMRALTEGHKDRQDRFYHLDCWHWGWIASKPDR